MNHRYILCQYVAQQEIHVLCGGEGEHLYGYYRILILHLWKHAMYYKVCGAANVAGNTVCTVCAQPIEEDSGKTWDGSLLNGRYLYWLLRISVRKMRHRGRYHVLFRSRDPSSRERYGCSLYCLLLCFRTDTLSSQHRTSRTAMLIHPPAHPNSSKLMSSNCSCPVRLPV